MNVTASVTSVRVHVEELERVDHQRALVDLGRQAADDQVEGRRLQSARRLDPAHDGECLVVDEWDSPASFQGFFEDEAQNIGQLMASAGVNEQPGPPQFYEKMPLGDEF